MKEKNILSIGGGLVLLLFVIIILSPVFEEVKDKVFVEDGNLGFTQLKEIKDEAKGNFQNNTTVEEFQELVGNIADEMRENISPKIQETFSDV